MKSFLKTVDGTYVPLLPKVTTIGRENCDFTIPVPGVDYQHSVIEYSEQEDCFVIQDLNTAQGTYVNDVRVQNAAVRLAPGDRIRFGYNGQTFELCVDNSIPFQTHAEHNRNPSINSALVSQELQQQVEQSRPIGNGTVTHEFQIQYDHNSNRQEQKQLHNVSIPHVSQRPPIWAQPIAVLSEQTGNNQQHHYSTSHGLPQISYGVSNIQSSSLWSQPTTQATQPPLPRPPLRSRPLSAGSARRPMTSAPPVGTPVQRTNVTSGWVSGQLTRTSSIPELQSQEKDQKIAQLSDELGRLQGAEFESVRKDSLIHQLQQQIHDLQSKAQQEPSVIMGGDIDLSSQLLHLEAEVTAKKQEILELKEQLGRFSTDRSNSPQLLRQELGERVKEVTQLRNELDKVKKDKNIASGLVTQMQRDVSNKENTIGKMTRDIEVLKKELRDRDTQISTNTRKIQENLKKQDEENAREKELVNLRQKFKATENTVEDQKNKISNLQDELEQAKAKTTSLEESENKLTAELDQLKQQLTNVQHSERVVRVDLQKSTSRIDSFKSRIIQVAYAVPGSLVPEREMTDDEVVEVLKEKLESLGRLHELEDQYSAAMRTSEQFHEAGQNLKNQLQKSLDRLKESSRLAKQVKREIDTMRAVETEENLVWVRDLLTGVLENEVEWEDSIELALETCGVDVKLSTESPSTHIKDLKAKWDASLSEIEKLKQDLADLSASNKEQMKAKVESLQSEWEAKLQEAVEKTKLEGEENLNRAIEDLKAVEQETREAALEVERRKTLELEEVISQLKKTIDDKEAEYSERLEEARVALAEVENLRAADISRQAEIDDLTKQKEEVIEQLKADKASLDEKYENELKLYKEQLRQHSITIVSLEEKVEHLVMTNSDLKSEITKLQGESREKPTPPPKPKVIIQRPTEEITALEHVANALRQENTLLKKEIREGQDVIMGLRRDLVGASARLSDISGEMSEAQKQEAERNKELIAQKTAELTELRQQMVKLTSIVDSQKSEIKKTEEELSKEKSEVIEAKKLAKEQANRLVELEEELNHEKMEQKKQLDILHQEGRITTELTSLGAQCRGERHELIIGRQREALSELRSKVKSLEQSRPPLPNQDQALQQVMLLKKELAEMRVNKALAEDRILQSATSLDREIGKTRGMITPSNVEADMERGAHRETMDALEASEATYLALLKTIASSLDLEEVEGLRPMAHIPRDERENLMTLREGVCQLLASRIQTLKERIGRKDELLQGYETDLARLRQSAEIAEQKSQQVESLANDVMSKAEESEYLRESLNRTRDKLNQEKRLNNAIKQKKTFHLENEPTNMEERTRKGTHCKIPDPMESVRRKKQRELLRRKNYEIKTLKSDLCETERTLYDKEKRLMSLETKLDLERPPLEVLH